MNRKPLEPRCGQKKRSINLTVMDRISITDLLRSLLCHHEVPSKNFLLLFESNIKFCNDENRQKQACLQIFEN